MLIALAQHGLSQTDPLNALRDRQYLQLEDNLLLFSFHARKAIELAGLTSVARAAAVFRPAGTPPAGVAALSISAKGSCDLWWILNRLVHSRFLSIEEAEQEEDPAVWSVTMGIDSVWAPSVLVVRSDKDAETEHHWVEIPKLLLAFMSLRSEFDNAVEGLVW
ncbi:MAG: hypothetical protein L0177_15705 [Chloroflexi bacterium]|nr:hypothetical protein [Chloroflexota bacterium]